MPRRRACRLPPRRGSRPPRLALLLPLSRTHRLPGLNTCAAPTELRSDYISRSCARGRASLTFLQTVIVTRTAFLRLFSMALVGVRVRPALLASAFPFHPPDPSHFPPHFRHPF